MSFKAASSRSEAAYRKYAYCMSHESHHLAAELFPLLAEYIVRYSTCLNVDQLLVHQATGWPDYLRHVSRACYSTATTP